MFIQYFHNLVPSWSPQTLSLKHLLGLTSALQHLPANILDDLVEEGYSRLRITPLVQKSIMDWDQVSEMGQYEITFGSHGLHHYILPTVDSNLKRREIVESLELLKQNEANIASFFSYPLGYFDKESVTMVAKAGYKGALTAKTGYNTSKTYSFLLNRISLHENISNTPDLFWFRILQGILSGFGPTNIDE
jgi:hypothetical protein